MLGSGELLTASKSVIKYMRATKSGRAVPRPISIVMIIT